MSLEEVAKRARVSAATVSRALNDIDVVRNSTRARVMKAVAELNYDRAALAARQGMIASNLENPFFFDIFRTLEADAHAHGYEVLVANTDYRAEQPGWKAAGRPRGRCSRAASGRPPSRV